MQTDHGEPCGTNHSSFCLNGGICYMIPSDPCPYCRCIDNYTGLRCEAVLLPSKKTQAKSGLLNTFLVLAIFLGVFLSVAVYVLCRIRRKLKMSQTTRGYNFHNIECKTEAT